MLRSRRRGWDGDAEGGDLVEVVLGLDHAHERRVRAARGDVEWGLAAGVAARAVGAEVEQRRRAEDADEQRRREHARRKRAVRPGQSAVTDKAVLTGKKPARFDYEDEDEHNNNNDGSNSNSINKKVEL